MYPFTGFRSQSLSAPNEQCVDSTDPFANEQTSRLWSCVCFVSWYYRRRCVCRCLGLKKLFQRRRTPARPARPAPGWPHTVYTPSRAPRPRARARGGRVRVRSRGRPPAPRGAFFPCGLRSKVGLRISKPLNLNHAKRKTERNLPLWRHSDVLGVAAQSACPLTVSPAASCVSLTKTEIGRVMDPAAVNVLFQVVHDWPCPASRYLRWPLRPSRARQTMPSGYCCASLARHRSSSSYLDGFLV